MTSERCWDIQHMPHDASDRLGTQTRLLNEGWEPYGADEFGHHYRRRRPIQQAVVVDFWMAAHRLKLLRRLFPDWQVIRAGAELPAGPPIYDRVVLLWKPRSHEARLWLNQGMRSKMRPPARFEYLL